LEKRQEKKREEIQGGKARREHFNRLLPVALELHTLNKRRKGRNVGSVELTGGNRWVKKGEGGF